MTVRISNVSRTSYDHISYPFQRLVIIRFCFQICVCFSILIRPAATVNYRLRISDLPTSESYIRLFWVVGTKTVTNCKDIMNELWACIQNMPFPPKNIISYKASTWFVFFFLLWKHRSPFKPLQRLGWCSCSTQSLKKWAARNMCLSETEHTWTLLCEVMSNIWDCFFFFLFLRLCWATLRKILAFQKGALVSWFLGEKWKWQINRTKMKRKQYSKNVALNND